MTTITQETVQQAVRILRDSTWKHPENWKKEALGFLKESVGVKSLTRKSTIVAELNRIVAEKFKPEYIKQYGEPITKCQQVFDAVRAGKTVHWLSSIYVVKQWQDDFNVICTCSDMCHGLAAKTESTFASGDLASEFYVA